MPYRGILAGAKPDTWKDYTPVLRAVQGLGDPAAVQPVLGAGGIARGRYQETLEGFVIAQFYFEFGTSPTPGTATAYAISLPKKANRWTKSSLLPAGADLPIGTARVSQGQAADPSFEMVVIPTLCDPFLSFGPGDEDGYCQLFHQGCRAQGQATIAASGTSVTVTHGLNDKIRPEDITITATGTPSGSNWQYAYVTISNATQFAISTKASVGTGGQTFAWSINATPWTDSGNNPSIVPMLVRPDAPWVPTAGCLIAGELFYEIVT